MCHFDVGRMDPFSLQSLLQGVAPKAPPVALGANAESALKVERDPEGRCRGGCDLSSFRSVCLFSGEPSSAQIPFPKERNHSPHYTLVQMFVLESPAKILKRWF